MTAVETFQALWVLMALPGFAVLRRAGRAWLDQGAFAALSVSYLTTFALLTPIGVLGYWLHWPIEVLSGALLGLMVLAALDLARHWRELALLPRPTLLGVIVLLLVLADYFAARRVGAHFVGDAHYHISKVRVLMDHGLVNWDPYAPDRLFDTVYHSNLYHAIIAAWAHLTGLEAFEAWSRMLPWTKLLLAGSAQALASALLRSRPLSLAAAAAAVLAWFPLTMLPYPNQLAGLWALPVALAGGVDLLAGDRPRRAAIGIVVATLVLAQLHAMYFAFACLLLGPSLLAVAAFALARKRTRRAAVAPLLGLLALSVGLPWFGVSFLARRVPALQEMIAEASSQTPPEPGELAAEAADEAKPADEEAAEDARASNRRYRGFSLLPNGRIAYDPGEIGDPRNARVHIFVALLLLCFVRQPRRVWALSAFLASVLVVMHVPLVCTWAARVAGSPWILRRLDVIVIFTALAIVPGAIGGLLSDRGWLRGPAPHLLFAGALAYAWVMGTDYGPWTRTKYRARVERPDKQETELRREARRLELLRAVPSGSVIATPFSRSVEIPRVCDCYAMALRDEEGLHGMRDMPDRQRALAQILNVRTHNITRASLMRRFQVRHIFVGRTRYSKELRKAVAPLTVKVQQSKAGMLIELDPERDLPP